MPWEWLVLGGFVTGVIALVLFRKNLYVQKYWKYTLLLLPFVVLVAFRVMSKRRQGQGDNTIPDSPNSLADDIRQIKDDLYEVNLETAAQVAAAREGSNVTIEQIESIKQMDNQQDRIKRLAALIN